MNPNERVAQCVHHEGNERCKNLTRGLRNYCDYHLEQIRTARAQREEVQRANLVKTALTVIGLIFLVLTVAGICLWEAYHGK